MDIDGDCNNDDYHEYFGRSARHRRYNLRL